MQLRHPRRGQENSRQVRHNDDDDLVFFNLDTFRSFFANRSMLGLEDEDSMDKMETSPPPLSPQASAPVLATPPQSPSPSPDQTEQSCVKKLGLTGKSPLLSPEPRVKDKLSPKASKSSKSKTCDDTEESSFSKLVSGKKVEEEEHSSEDEERSAHKAVKKHRTEAESEEKVTAKKRRKLEKKAKSKEIVNSTESESEKVEEEPEELVTDNRSKESPDEPMPDESSSSPPPGLENGSSSSETQNGLDSHIFRPSDLKVKPKGLVDALSNFFTPGLKRTSRTAMNSLIKPETMKHDEGKDSSKKVRLSVDEKDESAKKDDSKVDQERKRHASAGQSQVKQLFDGLSHLYNDCDSRLRSAPKDSSKEGSKEASEKGDDEGEAKDSAKEDQSSDKKAKSPLRMSDSERQEKDEEKKADSKMTEEEDKSRGSSKNRLVLGMTTNTLVCFSLVDSAVHLSF